LIDSISGVQPPKPLAFAQGFDVWRIAERPEKPSSTVLCVVAKPALQAALAPRVLVVRAHLGFPVVHTAFYGVEAVAFNMVRRGARSEEAYGLTAVELEVVGGHDREKDEESKICSHLAEWSE
jgi:hypothetical protein